MITTRYVREHIEAIRASLKKRNSSFPIDELLKLDEEWRATKTRLQELQAQRNRQSLDIARLKKEGKDASGLINDLATVKGSITEMEHAMPAKEARIEELLMNMPNVLHESVPFGEGDSGNVEIKRWGDATKRLQKGHAEILEELGLVDLERAAKTAGARFYYLKGDLVMLEQALMRFALDELTKKGYMAISPPFMIRKDLYRGVTALGDFEEMLYRVAEPKEAESRKDFEKTEENLFLIATAEHPIAAMHAGEVLQAKDLPLRYVGVSPCFRREAGSHGKDTKGIFRVHQFYKVEQFIFSKADDSWKYFDELLANEEYLYQKLGIPYHAVNICTGDIGTVAAKKIDLEAYMPGQGTYREVTSCSNCTDWQSARLDIKYDEGGERRFVHTLNATAVATTRTLVAIVENYYNPDGTITVPKALVPYMGKETIGRAKA